MRIKLGLPVLLSLILPAMAGAASGPDEIPRVTQFESIGGVFDVFKMVVNWIFTFLMVAAVAFILFAAFKYLTAAGSKDGIQVANRMLLYAVIAVAIGMLAKTIPALVRQFVQGGGYSSGGVDGTLPSNSWGSDMQAPGIEGGSLNDLYD